ncbi:MAG: hypothetical protein ACLFVU_12780 [Phycisphaerae bacterium]
MRGNLHGSFAAGSLFLVLAASLLISTGCQGGNPGYEQRFEKRADFVIEQTAARSPEQLLDWFNSNPYFQNAGGDPHKYAMPVVLARLHEDPNDAEALKLYRFLMEVDKKKGDRGLYHFAVFQRARLYLMGRGKLPEDVLESNEYDMRNFAKITRRGGTENHKMMHKASGYVLAEHIDGPYKGMSREQHMKELRTWLTDQVKRLYTIGQGEYDSSTYVGFSAASWANVYDYTDDPYMKKLSRAALEWYATALARKYFHGAQLGPESRGFARQAVGTIDEKPGFPGTKGMNYSQVGTHTDWMCWLWWDDSVRGVWMDRDKVEVNRYPAHVLAMSDYRPFRAIRRLGRKQVKLPYEARGSKPIYSGPQGNYIQEYLYQADQYAMGTLYHPEKGVRTSGTILPQTTMFKLLALDKNSLGVFGATNGYHGHYPLEGRTPYDQYHQKRSAALNVCYVNTEEDQRTKHRSILGFPKGNRPSEKGGWYFWQVNKTFVAARPLNGKAAVREIQRYNNKKKETQTVESDTNEWLVSPGKLTGWAIQVAQKPEYNSLSAFQQAVLEKVKLDLSDFNETDRTVGMTSLLGDTLTLKHTGGPGGKPEIRTNGKAVSYENWPVFESPYVKQELNSGVLRVSDGERTLVIDVTGDTPKFTESNTK